MRRRKPRISNMYWHCRTFNVTPYRSLMKAANPLPSQIPLAIPTDSGGCRKIDLISFSCSSFSRRGRPVRSPSTNPAKPLSSKWRTQYSTVRGESPSRRLTSGQLIPWATSNTPWRRWSYRDSSERRISSCNPSTMVGASTMVNGLMKKLYHISFLYAIIYCAIYKSRRYGMSTKWGFDNH